jgi:hypothetical protein
MKKAATLRGAAASENLESSYAWLGVEYAGGLNGTGAA